MDPPQLHLWGRSLCNPIIPHPYWGPLYKPPPNCICMGGGVPVQLTLLLHPYGGVPYATPPSPLNPYRASPCNPFPLHSMGGSQYPPSCTHMGGTLSYMLLQGPPKCTPIEGPLCNLPSRPRDASPHFTPPNWGGGWGVPSNPPLPPDLPQLVPVLPRNWRLRGSHTKARHSANLCPQLRFSLSRAMWGAPPRSPPPPAPATPPVSLPVSLRSARAGTRTRDSPLPPPHRLI